MNQFTLQTFDYFAANILISRAINAFHRLTKTCRLKNIVTYINVKVKVHEISEYMFTFST